MSRLLQYLPWRVLDPEQAELFYVPLLPKVCTHLTSKLLACTCSAHQNARELPVRTSWEACAAQARATIQPDVARVRRTHPGLLQECRLTTPSQDNNKVAQFLQDSPYYQRKGGTDHFFICTSVMLSGLQ